MPLNELPGMIYDIIFREFPHRYEPGLYPVGNPERHSPVILTGNYTETVRRMKKALKGLDAWLLVSNSKGINVWCAAGGGHFTHHDVISSIITSGVEKQVDNHTLILPQLGATGIERSRITESTGWKTRWGPARLEDLPAFLSQGHSATPGQRFMRFPLRERLEMATMWAIPMILIGFLFFSLLGGLVVGYSVAISAGVVTYSIFSLLPKVNLRGHRRWVFLSIFASAGIITGLVLLDLISSMALKTIVLTVVGSAVESMVLSIDLEGTTPWYGSYINTFGNHASIELVEDRCNGSADCIQVCPRDVFRMDGTERKVKLKSPMDCIECGACIVQCPKDALRFRYQDGSVVEAAIIRKTRMNMLGKRTVSVPEEMQQRN